MEKSRKKNTSQKQAGLKFVCSGRQRKRGRGRKRGSGKPDPALQLYTRTLRARVMVYHQEKCLLVPRRPPLVHLLEANFPLVIYRETILQFNAVASPRVFRHFCSRDSTNAGNDVCSRVHYILAGTLMSRLFSVASKFEEQRASYLMRYITLVRERINSLRLICTQYMYHYNIRHLEINLEFFIIP